MAHNFYSNFQGSVRTGDVDLSLNLWVNEVSDLIAFHSQKLIDLLNKTGISAPNSLSSEDLADKVLDNIASNDKLQKGIAFLIAEGNELITPGKDWKRHIDRIAYAYGKLLKGVGTTPSVKASVKNDLMQHIKSKASSNAAGPERPVFKEANPDQKKKAKVIVWGLIAAGALGITALCVYMYRRNAKLAGMAAGGLTPGASPVVINMPPPQGMPQAVPPPIAVPVMAGVAA